MGRCLRINLAIADHRAVIEIVALLVAGYIAAETFLPNRCFMKAISKTEVLFRSPKALGSDLRYIHPDFPQYVHHK